MSQKSSLPQAAKSVSQALMPDTRFDHQLEFRAAEIGARRRVIDAAKGDGRVAAPEFSRLMQLLADHRRGSDNDSRHGP